MEGAGTSTLHGRMSILLWFYYETLLTPGRQVVVDVLGITVTMLVASAILGVTTEELPGTTGTG